MPRVSKEATTESGRPSRVPRHEQSDKINVVYQDPNYAYRWVNQRPGRIESFLLAGWEMAPGDTVLGDTSVEDQITRTSGAIERHMGQGTKANLMRIRREFYNEDQEAKQRQLDISEQAMNREAMQGRYGTFKVEKSRLGRFTSAENE
jgi:hypothetical protein